MVEAHESAGVPGAMAALLRPDEAAVRQLCREIAEETGLVLGIANYNGPGQVVVSGHAAAVARAVEEARPRRAAARAVDLPVGAAFHSPYMWAAAERIAALLGTDAGALRGELGALDVGEASPEELEAVLARCADEGACAAGPEVALADASTPVLSNTTATAATDAAALRWRATLHSPAPVHWGRSLEEARRLGATAFLEVGTGAAQTAIAAKVLGGGVETRYAHALHPVPPPASPLTPHTWAAGRSARTRRRWPTCPPRSRSRKGATAPHRSFPSLQHTARPFPSIPPDPVGREGGSRRLYACSRPVGKAVSHALASTSLTTRRLESRCPRS